MSIIVGVLSAASVFFTQKQSLVSNTKHTSAYRPYEQGEKNVYKLCSVKLPEDNCRPTSLTVSYYGCEINVSIQRMNGGGGSNGLGSLDVKGSDQKVIVELYQFSFKLSESIICQGVEGVLDPLRYHNSEVSKLAFDALNKYLKENKCEYHINPYFKFKEGDKWVFDYDAFYFALNV